MLHACVQRFDVTGNLKILAKFLASKRCPSFDGFTFGVSERRLDGLVFGIIGSIKYLTKFASRPDA
jgi:hypothetical protein